MNKKYGRVVILGRPNTGKSTLLNAIMGQKVAITSPLPQTTRKSRRVVYKSEKGKIIFSDTPGIMGKVVDIVGKKINLEAPKELVGADLILMLVDLSREKTEEENKVIGLVRKMEVPKILVYNKSDLIETENKHLASYEWMEEEFDRFISISALKETHVKGLINIIFELLPEKSRKGIKEEIESRENDKKPAMGINSTEYVEELIREKCYLCLRQEVPYSVAVEVASIEDKGKMIVIRAEILTKEERYKKMIIGSRGRKIKQIGTATRKELELMAGRKIFLDLEVRVDKHWPERLLEK
ncbi:GTPase Era [Patescibacteria group bacterium]|nr:GTPase Era [Patescibacteria group bacterium]